jgi:hypothetical protein
VQLELALDLLHTHVHLHSALAVAVAGPTSQVDIQLAPGTNPREVECPGPGTRTPPKTRTQQRTLQSPNAVRLQKRRKSNTR